MEESRSMQIAIANGVRKNKSISLFFSFHMHSFSISTTCSYITAYKGAQDPEHVNFLLDTINPNVDANLLKTNNKKISKMHKRLINT
jgi:hypothetical protein